GDKERIVRVSELIKSGNREWDQEAILQTFNPVDAALILTIPLKSTPQPDKLIWHWGKKGCLRKFSELQWTSVTCFLHNAAAVKMLNKSMAIHHSCLQLVGE
ncbi:ribonuclease H-like superfamily protein, partial [Striga asiatica]